MDLDPDIPLPSVEATDRVTPATPRNQKARDVNVQLNSRSTTQSSSQRTESSPVRAPYRSPRASTPTRSTSRSVSVASVRSERSQTPRLDKKRSVPNLSLQSPAPAHQFRRASSNLNPATPVRSKSPEKPKMTPASVAKEYFARDLRGHARDSKTVVFTHDACYGHRFSRLKSSRATLASIVERPERIHATLLGASTAYVRLGQKHRDGSSAPHPEQEVRQGPFALVKTTRSVPLNHPAVTAVHGTKWMDSLQIMCDSAEARLNLGQKELSRPLGHTKDSKNNTLPPLHVGDLYLAAESLNALQGCLGGVFDAVDSVFQPENQCSKAFVCIRPPGHHCSAEMPSGFCWLNNVHVGISYAAMNHGLTHAAIIDFDLHHGDGSQTITWEHNRDAHFATNPKSVPTHKKIPIGYYSLHDINSYPCEYGDEEKVLNASTCIHTAHGQSIWNVHLEPWKSHADFWHLYETKYKILLDKARSFLETQSDLLRRAGIQPKAAIFLSSGFDASEWEGEGMQRHKVNVPTDFYARITSDVVELASDLVTGVDERVISVLEGGYSDRALTSGVMSHLCGLVHEPVAQAKPTQGLNKMLVDTPQPKHDPTWWHESNLQMLEALVAGELPIPQAPKDKGASSYSSPTTASTARMTDTAKERQSLTAAMEARLLLNNAPPEPVPEVDWVTASYELSRLLIPSDRQTLSCTYEELNIELNRTRRDRLSLADLPKSVGLEDKRQLRERVLVPKKTSPAKPPSRSSRRTTIAAASDLPDPGIRTRSRSRRRSSAASSMMSEFQDLRLLNETTVTPAEARVPTGPAPKAVTTSPKKTRAPVKKPAGTTIAVKATKPVKPVSKEGSRSRPNSQSAASEQTTDAMDELTNGMKKINIKLKMPTEDEHLANQKRSEVSPTPVVATKSKPVRKPPIPKVVKTIKPKTSKTTTLTSDSTMIPSKQLATTGQSSQLEQLPTSTQEHASQMNRPTESTPVQAQPPSALTVDHANQSSDVKTEHSTTDQSLPAGDEMNGIHYPTINLKFESASPPPTS